VGEWDICRGENERMDSRGQTRYRHEGLRQSSPGGRLGRTLSGQSRKRRQAARQPHAQRQSLAAAGSLSGGLGGHAEEGLLSAGLLFPQVGYMAFARPLSPQPAPCSRSPSAFCAIKPNIANWATTILTGYIRNVRATGWSVPAAQSRV
jgi:hypothetical protein